MPRNVFKMFVWNLALKLQLIECHLPYKVVENIMCM